MTSWGGGEREFQVLIDPQRLYARGLGFGDVLAALPINNGQVGGNVMEIAQNDPRLDVTLHLADQVPAGLAVIEMTLAVFLSLPSTVTFSTDIASGGW